MYSADRLRELMEAQGRRSDWLASVAEYDTATVSRVLNGSQAMSEKFAQRAAAALGVPVHWLLAESAVAS